MAELEGMGLPLPSAVSLPVLLVGVPTKLHSGHCPAVCPRGPGPRLPWNPFPFLTHILPG